MIFDTLDHLQSYTKIHPQLSTVQEFLKNHPLESLPYGRTEVGDGAYVLVSEYETKDLSEKFIECHRKHVDVHMVIEGVEQIGVCSCDDCRVIQTYDQEKDFEKLDGSVDLVTLKTGFFLLAFPWDAHVAGLKVEDVEGRMKKAVFKIPVL